MRWTNSNLGIPLEDFKSKWERGHLTHVSNGEICPYHNSRFEEGWIPLAIASYYPALNRFNSHSSKLANKIVETLEKEGKYEFGKHQYNFSELKPALEEIMGCIPCDIDMIVADKQEQHLMLDRKAFTIYGSPDEKEIQWYIKKN
jgi:hypothetical protein